jgi:acyl transferase domain-containing protein/phosphopantetheinyl transferase
VSEPIAIVGMSCLFPGAPDVDAFWANILGKVDAVSAPPPGAWDADVYYDPSFEDTDKTYCRRGGYLGSLTTFDPLAHGIPPVSVGGEPDQWLALQLATDALADTGWDELPERVRARTGIVLGKGTYLNGGNAIAVQRGLVVGQTLEILRRLHPEYTDADIDLLRDEMKRALPPLGPERVPGLIPNIVVGRIANRLDLMGPTYTVDAACASSLVAVDLAMRDLRDGACDLVLAGGSQVWMPVPTLSLFCQLGALSRTEQIRPFDANADGTLLGEGIGMVVLKRLSDARRDGDRVYATILGVGIASDGRGVGVMAPRVEGETLALRRAYDAAGVSPATVELIEAHGTATPVGDVVEIDALTQVFGGRDGALPRCALGTVKSMISHTIPASGIAGIIKLALSLHHRVLPPTLHCDEPNPKLGIERTPFYINTETRPWIHGGRVPRRAGINAFGFGGINAHAVLEEVEETGDRVHLPWDSEVVLFESETPAGLADAARELAGRLEEPGRLRLSDVAFTSSRRVGRAATPLRLAVVATSLADLRAKLDKAVERLERPGCRRIKGMSGIYYESEPLGRDGKVVLVFPGEGAQYPGMLADLCLRFPEVRAAFDDVHRDFDDHPRDDLCSDWVFPRPAFTEAERREATRRLMEMDIAVEAVLCSNDGMHRLLRRLGLRADAYVGHSTGELSAAHAAGVLQIDDDERRAAFSVAVNRCYAAATEDDELPRAVLLAVAAEREQVEAVAREAGGELYVAMDNCPHQAVIAGEPAAAERALRIIERDGLIHERLPYDRAVHTPRFAPYAERLRHVFDATDVGAARTPLYSCTTGGPYPDDVALIRELLVEHWVSPVEFRRTIEALHDGGARVFVECGPRGNMTAFIEDILRGREHCAVPADVQRRSGITQLNHLVARLSTHGVDLDLEQLYAGRAAREVRWEDEPEASAPARNGRIDLATRWPMLRLSDEAVQAVEPHPPAPPEDAPAVGNGHLSPAATIVLPEPPAAAPEAELAMDAHLETMSRFLTAQEEVMEAFLLAPEPSTHPVLGTVIASTPGAELVTRRAIDPERDRYLQDHRLGGGLAVMPLAMSLAVVAEAAAALVPNLGVVGLRDVRAHRWIAFGDDEQEVQVTARRLDQDGADVRVAVELRNLTEDAEAGEAPERPVVEATVVLADVLPPPPAPLPPLDDPRGSRRPPEQLYREVMFHGPRWQAVRAIEATGAHGARARLERLPVDDFWAGGPATPLALDPVALDAAGQVVGFWTADRLDRGQVVFPFRLAALDVHGPTPAVGESLACTARIDLLGEQLVRSDIDVRGADGRPWLRLSGWEDKRFEVPSALLPLVSGQADGAMSAEWPSALAGATDGRPLQCRRLVARVPADGGPWMRAWAQRVLTRGEREQLGALRAPETRRLEWLGARTAAKEAVRRLVRDEHGLELEFADIEIRTGEQGRPLVAGPRLARLDPAPVVSLAHTDGRAVALAALGGRVGIDIEVVRPRPDGFAEVAFSDAELELLRPVAGEAAEWTLRCWCAKEAVAKALGSGLVRTPREVAVVAIDHERGRVAVELGGRLAELHPDLAGLHLTAQTHREDDLIVATTLCAKGETPA